MEEMAFEGHVYRHHQVERMRHLRQIYWHNVHRFRKKGEMWRAHSARRNAYQVEEQLANINEYVDRHEYDVAW